MIVTALLLASGCRTCDALPAIDAGDEADADSASGLDAAPPDAESPGDRFTTPVTPDGLGSTSNDSGPTLTADLLEMVFVSDRPGPGMKDLWTTTRMATADAWSAPTVLAGLSSSAPEDHPWIAPDGLTLYFSSGRNGGPGGFDIYLATRLARTDPWSAPTVVTELSIDDDDFSFTSTPDGLIGVLDRDRNSASGRDMYITTRAATTAPWGPLTAIAGVNSLTDDLTPVLADGGKALYFSRGQQAPMLENILFAKRATTSETFTPPIAVPVVSSDARDLDPWLSEDQRTIYFVRQAAPSRTQLVFATRMTP